MIYPEQLYRLRPGELDEPQSWLTPQFDVGDSGLLLLGTVDFDFFTVPGNRVLVLSSVTGLGMPGAAQAVREGRIVVLSPTLSIAAELAIATYAAVANRREALNWSGQIIVPPNWTVRITMSFDAAVAANQVHAALGGMLIPLGTIQRQ